LPRNSVIGPGQTNLDLSLFKGLSLGESRNMEFRAEFFNILNHANFGNPGLKIFTSAAGAISPTAGAISSMNGTPRQIQFALKYTF
jgi:hypothetical protein